MADQPFVDGAPLTAASMTARLTAAQDALNGLESRNIAPRVLNPAQVQSAVNPTFPITSYVDELTGVDGPYTNVYPGYNVSTFLGNGPGAGTGWRQVMGVGWLPIRLDQPQTSPYMTALWIKCNLVCHSIYEAPAPPVHSLLQHNWRMCLALMRVTLAGTYTIIARTERCFPCDLEIQEDKDTDGLIRADMALETVITANDTGTDDVQAIVAVVSMFSDDGPPIVGTLTGNIGRGTLSCVPMRAEVK